MNTRYDIAAANAREAIEELRLAAYEQGYKDAVDALKQVAPVSKELTRDEVVEMAHRSVESLKRPGNDFVGSRGWEYREHLHGDGSGDAYNAEYIINSDKRTVVVLLRGYSTGWVLRKGIAKCGPEECFNVHIGKAIALHRALDLDVPKELLSAPQPTEVRVGDIVEYSKSDGNILVVESSKHSIKPTETRLSVAETGFELADTFRIINDSREGE